MGASDYIWVVLLFSGIALFLIARFRLGKTKRFFITDYQRGVRYKNGIFAGVLDLGYYNCYTPSEQLVIVDMRPQPFVIERLIYQDAVQAPSVISIGAELKVSDPYRSCTALKDQVADSVAIVRDVLLATVSKGITDAAVEGRKRTADEVTDAANAELSKRGMCVSSMEITEVWSRVARPTQKAGAN